jgi:hypothetical protein
MFFECKVVKAYKLKLIEQLKRDDFGAVQII